MDASIVHQMVYWVAVDGKLIASPANLPNFRFFESPDKRKPWSLDSIEKYRVKLRVADGLSDGNLGGNKLKSHLQ